MNASRFPLPRLTRPGVRSDPSEWRPAAPPIAHVRRDATHDPHRSGGVERPFASPTSRIVGPDGCPGWSIGAACVAIDLTRRFNYDP